MKENLQLSKTNSKVTPNVCLKFLFFFILDTTTDQNIGTCFPNLRSKIKNYEQVMIPKAKGRMGNCNGQEYEPKQKIIRALI